MSCKKRAYDSMEDAKLKLAKIQAEEGDNKKPIRAYLCPKCKKFHLTSFTKKTQQRVVKIRQNIEKSELHREAYYWIKKNKWNNERKPKILQKFTRSDFDGDDIG